MSGGERQRGTTGLLVALDVIREAGSNPNWGQVAFAVPWFNLALIFVVVYVAALVATALPARRGARVEPATALRYQ